MKSCMLYCSNNCYSVFQNSFTFTQDRLLGKRDSSFEDSARDRNLNGTFLNRSHSNSKTDSSDNSDSSICVESGSVDLSDVIENEQNDLSGKTDSNSSPVRQISHQGNKRLQHSAQKDTKIGHVRKKLPEGKRLQFPYSVMHCELINFN